jgi:hypothetical protein
LCAILLAAGVRGAAGPLVVIVHPDSGITQMTRAEVGRLFLGSQKRLASGLVALPVEPLSPALDRVRFYQMLLHLPLPQVRSYWAQLYFSAQAQPPRQAKDNQEVLEIVAANKGAVGFVEQSQVNGRVRAVLTLDDPDAR